MQLEQEYEEKQMVLHEKQDLEGLIGTLCDQVKGRREQMFGRIHSGPIREMDSWGVQLEGSSEQARF